MFVNALAVTCHNPRHFYGYDLVKILSDRVASSKSPVPSAYLTLCNLNWTLSHSDVKSLVNLLNKQSKYPFQLGKMHFYFVLLKWKNNIFVYCKLLRISLILKILLHPKVFIIDSCNVYTVFCITVTSLETLRNSRRH